MLPFIILQINRVYRPTSTNICPDLLPDSGVWYLILSLSFQPLHLSAVYWLLKKWCALTCPLLKTFTLKVKKKVSSCNSSAMCYILPQLNNLEKAVAATHTFLKKNPDDVLLTKNMNYYKTLFDVEEYLIDHEEQPYEVCTLSTVVLHQWEVWCLSSMFFFLFLFLNESLYYTECFLEKCDALQQRRLQQQC